MKPTFRRYLISFLFFGLLGAILFFVFDLAKDKPFDPVRFILRFFIFGIGGLLNVWLTYRLDKRKNDSNKNAI